MCTVSFVSTSDKIIITSNRDEAVLRKAIPPKTYLINGKKITFPKDPKGGGTWYAVNENRIVLVLLNGAEEKHKHQPPYNRSRGLIVLELISSDSPIEEWSTIDLENVEPFTLVLFQDSNLFQLRWNGNLRSSENLDASQNHIWSSSTLYSKEIRELRLQWFSKFMKKNQDVSEFDMYNFHRNTENSDIENGLIINRNNALKTLTITQTVLQNQNIAMNHYDLLEEKNYSLVVEKDSKSLPEAWGLNSESH